MRSLNLWYRSQIFWEVFIADYITKVCAEAFLTGKPFQVADFLTFKLAYNYGISWSLFSTQYFLGWALISVVTTAVLTLLAYQTTERQKEGYSVVGATLILAGGFANLVDRLRVGAVTDFISISFGGWSFPTFNLADIAITVGVCIMVYEYVMEE